jgi:hypothetical protein
MEDKIIERMEAQERKIEAIWISVEKTRKYFLFTMITSIAMFVLPLIGLVIAIPIVLSVFSQSMEGLL